MADIGAIAETCDRTRRWVMVQPLRLYLADEGAKILAIQKGREQLANGEARDLDALTRALEAIVGGAGSRLIVEERTARLRII